MIDEIDSSYDSYARGCFDLSSKLAEPFCWAYGMLRYRSISPLDPNKFDNATSKVKEIATRVFIFTSAAIAFTCAATHAVIAGVIMGTGSKIFRALGFALRKEPFNYTRGSGPEKILQKGQAKVMNWSLCGEYRGLSYRNGGVIPWRSRIDKIVEQIKAQDPDVLVLQQINDTALVEALISRLDKQYAHFFTHIGGSTWENFNGCMVISKCAVEGFSHKKLDEASSFEAFEIKADPRDEIPCMRLIATELIAGKENKEKRTEQVAQIINHLEKETLNLPTLFVANNADRSDPEEDAFLSKYLSDSYRGNEPTNTDQLAIQWDPAFKGPGETYDLVSLVKRQIPGERILPVVERNIRLVSCELVKGFDSTTYDTKESLSNHHGIAMTFAGLKSSPG